MCDSEPIHDVPECCSVLTVYKTKSPEPMSGTDKTAIPLAHMIRFRDNGRNPATAIPHHTQSDAVCG